MKDIRIIYGNAKYFKSFHEALDTVAREKVYLEMTEAPPLAKVSSYQRGLIKKNGPVYYALDGQKVVGWCDIFPKDNPRMAHRGGLGMGLLKKYRGKGIGSMLMEATLAHAQKFGIEKVELQVYTSNPAGIALYKKFGFVEEGLLKSYRKVKSQSFDAITMAKFF